MKLLIVDDEPLVSVGIQSMVDWKKLNLELLSPAFNGKQALDLIEKYSPEIVITDIKMPIMTGLELMKYCREKNNDLPIFILLTVYEDFKYAKEAISFGAFDYLTKLDLTTETLEDVLQRAKKAVSKHIMSQDLSQTAFQEKVIFSMENKFYIYLLHNLFENEAQFQIQAKNLNIQLTDALYATAYCYIERAHYAPEEKTFSSSVNIIQLSKEILNKYLTCHIVSMDMEYFCIIFSWKKNEQQDFLNTMKEALNNLHNMIYSYFHKIMKCALGETVSSIFDIAVSYQTARLLVSSLNDSKWLAIYDSSLTNLVCQNTFNISILRTELSQAFEEFNEDKIKHLFHEIIVLFKNRTDKLLQAIDVSCNILHLCISLLPNGEELVTNIFANEPENYLAIHNYTTMPQIISYLSKLQDGLCKYMRKQQQSLTNHIVINIKKYVVSHIYEKITQREIASLFGITPNYLSILFKKHNDLCFNDYVNHAKIEVAKDLLCNQNLKIYEVAERLSFSNEFYFSKVFKNIVGCSPSQYIQSHITTSNL